MSGRAIRFSVCGIVCLPVLLLGCGFSAGCYAWNDAMPSAPHFERPPRSAHTEYRTSPVKLVWTGLIDIYARAISPADGPRSPSYPTGSAYGRQAVETHGLFLGVLLTADRLLHEADGPLGPVITVYGTKRYYDPLESNTYWWK